MRIFNPLRTGVYECKQKNASYLTVNSLRQLSVNLNIYKTFVVFIKKNVISSVEKARTFGLRQTQTACTKQ